MERTYQQSTDINKVNVALVLKRRFFSIFMVTYLPTILMNMINQATNYIPTKDKYDLIYTINM